MFGQPFRGVGGDDGLSPSGYRGRTFFARLAAGLPVRGFFAGFFTVPVVPPV
jgi:hypothetical protein